jgi:hypothetical protein
MIMLKVAAATVGAGTLFLVFAPDFGADFLLAMIACFS